MSGGFFENYEHYHIDEVARTIERLIRRAAEGPEQSSRSCEDYGPSEWEKNFYSELKPETKREFHQALLIIKQAAVYAQRIDYLMAGDDGEESFHRRLQEDLADNADSYSLDLSPPSP
jgi:hypothetical protein